MLENETTTVAKDKSKFTIDVTYEDENFDEKTISLTFRKKYNGRMQILDTAISKIHGEQMLTGLKILAQNAYASEDKSIFKNEDIVFALIPYMKLFTGDAIATIQKD